MKANPFPFSVQVYRCCSPHTILIQVLDESKFENLESVPVLLLLLLLLLNPQGIGDIILKSQAESLFEVDVALSLSLLPISPYMKV
jgi:hypothetical protein